jgi:hypothetical protein
MKQSLPQTAYRSHTILADPSAQSFSLSMVNAAHP